MTSTRRRTRRPVTAQEKEEIIALFLDVGVVATVARKVGRDYAVVERVVDRAGLSRRRYLPRYNRDSQLIREIHETDGLWMANRLPLHEYITELIQLQAPPAPRWWCSLAQPTWTPPCSATRTGSISTGRTSATTSRSAPVPTAAWVTGWPVRRSG